MKLSDLKSEWIGEAGIYDVMVTSHETILNKNTGNPGVTFELVNDRFQKQKVTFWLTQKALFKLAQFAAHCQISDEEVDRAYGVRNGDLPEPNQHGHMILPDICHAVFHGRHVRINVEKNGEYHEVTSTMPVNGPLPEYRPTPRVRNDNELQKTSVAGEQEADDSLPF